MTSVCKRVAARMAQHVRVNYEIEVGALANPLNQPIDGIGRERPAALGLESNVPVVLRWSSRSARNSSPGMGWAAGVRPTDVQRWIAAPFNL